MSPSTSPSRRDFLKTAAGAGIVLAHASANNAQAAAPNNKGMTLVLPGVGASMKFRAGEDGAAGDALKNDSENLQIVCVFRE